MTPAMKKRLMEDWRRDLRQMGIAGALTELEIQSGFKRKSAELRRRIAYRLRQRGQLLKTIGAVFGVSAMTVSRMIQAHLIRIHGRGAKIARNKMNKKAMKKGIVL